jgi:enamine deaminase RidA (YjgF/YER057c/UK114 family)
MRTPHELPEVEGLPPSSGFAHAVVAAPGRTVYLGGQTAHGPDGRLAAGGIVEQFSAAAANVVRALDGASGAPSDLVSMQIYVTDVRAYKASLEQIGRAYRAHFGTHYPAIALFEVSSLFDPEALVELVAIAVVPAQR